MLTPTPRNVAASEDTCASSLLTTSSFPVITKNTEPSGPDSLTVTVFWGPWLMRSDRDDHDNHDAEADVRCPIDEKPSRNADEGIGRCTVVLAFVNTHSDPQTWSPL
jgi:hypothetical protein